MCDAHWRHGRHGGRVGLEDVAVGAIHCFSVCLAAPGPLRHSTVLIEAGQSRDAITAGNRLWDANGVDVDEPQPQNVRKKRSSTGPRVVASEVLGLNAAADRMNHKRAKTQTSKRRKKMFWKVPRRR